MRRQLAAKNAKKFAAEALGPQWVINYLFSTVSASRC